MRPGRKAGVFCFVELKPLRIVDVSVPTRQSPPDARNRAYIGHHRYWGYKLPTITDPARELVDLIRSLQIVSSRQSDGGLAELWGVKPWSSDFMLIIYTISARIDGLKLLTRKTDLDTDQKNEMCEHLENIRKAFGPSGMSNTWSHVLGSYLTPAHINPVSMLSGLVRPLQSYAKLGNDEVSELLEMINTLQVWLSDHQLHDHDFIRQSIIDGLDHLTFRLEHVGWLGWGYAIEGLKDLIHAYFVLERGVADSGENSTAAAALKNLGTFIRTTYSKMTILKDVTEVGDWMLRIYGGVMAASDGPTTALALLTHIQA